MRSPYIRQNLGVLILFLVAVAVALYHPDKVDILAVEGLKKLVEYQAKYHPDSKCTVENAIKRREWSDLPTADRKEYIRAVICLRSKPSITPNEIAPGARSRYDDFIAVHINQTLSIHFTGSFLSWHRYYIWAFERALREECGYKGYQPYWNWGRYASDPIHSPIFDGSDTSLSGNGLPYAYSGTPLTGATPGLGDGDTIPPAEGGGCISTGPFKNESMNLGPVAAVMPDVPPNPRPDGLGYNPRCIRRDINPNASRVTHANYTYQLITLPANSDIHWFQSDMQGNFTAGHWGVHTGGHYTIGADPGGDFFSSPGDPAFWVHHGMIDRVWWIWQMQDLATRQNVVSGTLTFQNAPPSRNATLDDMMDLGFCGGEERLGDLLSTLGGKGGDFCYIYV